MLEISYCFVTLTYIALIMLHFKNKASDLIQLRKSSKIRCLKLVKYVYCYSFIDKAEILMPSFKNLETETKQWVDL